MCQRIGRYDIGRVKIEVEDLKINSFWYKDSVHNLYSKNPFGCVMLITEIVSGLTYIFIFWCSVM